MSTFTAFAIVSVVSNTFTGFADVKPVRYESRWSGTLNDIESHIFEGRGIGQAGIYRDADKVTHAHEMTHGVNARLRNRAVAEMGAGMTAIYITEGRAYLFPRLPVRLTDIARATPAEWRDGHFNLYLVKQAQWWDDTPTYVFDEAIAYLNGAKVGLEYRMTRRVVESLEQAAKSYRFGVVLSNIIHSPEVDVFLQWFRHELEAVARVTESSGGRVDGVKAILATVGERQPHVAGPDPNGAIQPASANRYRTPMIRTVRPSECPDGNCPMY